jgi:hypothetical protein
VLVYWDPPVELEIDRCVYVLDEAGVPGHCGPVYVYVPDE